MSLDRSRNQKARKRKRGRPASDTPPASGLKGQLLAILRGNPAHTLQSAFDELKRKTKLRPDRSLKTKLRPWMTKAEVRKYFGPFKNPV